MRAPTALVLAGLSILHTGCDPRVFPYPDTRNRPVCCLAYFFCPTKESLVSAHGLSQSRCSGCECRCNHFAPDRWGLFTESTAAHFLDSFHEPESAFRPGMNEYRMDDFERVLHYGKDYSRRIHIHEAVNLFQYDYPASESSINAHALLTDAPWNRGHLLLRIVIQGPATEAGRSYSFRNGDGIAAENVQTRVRFNPSRVEAYRMLAVTPAEAEKSSHIGRWKPLRSNQSVTVLYELIPSPSEVSYLGPNGDPLIEINTTYFDPEDAPSGEQTFALTVGRSSYIPWHRAGTEMRFAAGVAAAAMQWNATAYRGYTTRENILAWLQQGMGDDPTGERGLFLEWADSRL